MMRSQDSPPYSACRPTLPNEASSGIYRTQSAFPRRLQNKANPSGAAERSHRQPMPNEPNAAARRPASPATHRCKTKPIRPAPSERSHHQPLPNEPNPAARRPAPSRAHDCKTKPIRPALAERSHRQPLPNEPNAAARRHALLQNKANPPRTRTKRSQPLGRQPARLAPPWRSACSSNSHPITKGN